MESKPTYWQRLRAHPGPPWATAFSVLFVAAGSSTWQGIAIGVVAACAVWGLVLWTARTQPVARRERVDYE